MYLSSRLGWPIIKKIKKIDKMLQGDGFIILFENNEVNQPGRKNT